MYQECPNGNNLVLGQFFIIYKWAPSSLSHPLSSIPREQTQSIKGGRAPLLSHLCIYSVGYARSTETEIMGIPREGGVNNNSIIILIMGQVGASLSSPTPTVSVWLFLDPPSRNIHMCHCIVSLAPGVSSPSPTYNTPGQRRRCSVATRTIKTGN